jgi:hypothetical protein
MAEFIGFVLDASCPTKIRGSVVELICVPVRHFMAFGWAQAMKSHANDEMQRDMVPLPQADTMITAPVRWLGTQDDAMAETPAPIAQDDPSVHRSNTPKATGFVARMIRDCAPLFNTSYGMFSHVAYSRSKVVMGLATGWRLSSVPQCNGLAPQQQAGISILASRV